MNEYINNFNSHSPTKMVSWLLLPHLPDGGVLLVMLNFLSRNPNPETPFFHKKKTNPKSDRTFYWHPFEFVHFFMHTHPTPLPIPTRPVSGHILLFDAFETVYYLLLHISWFQVQYVSAISIVFVLKSTVTLERGHFFYLHPPCSPSLPPSGWVSEKWG